MYTFEDSSDKFDSIAVCKFLDVWYSRMKELSAGKPNYKSKIHLMAIPRTSFLTPRIRASYD